MPRTSATGNTPGKEYDIPAINTKKLPFTIIGDSPLIMHKWSEKAKKQIRDAQTKQPKTKGHDIRNPYEDLIDSIYWLEGAPKEKTEDGFAKAIANGAKFGFPAVAVKAAAVAAGYRAGVTKDKVSQSGMIPVDGEFIEIQGTPGIREDMVRVNNGGADLRYRGEFKNWSAEIEVSYNASALSAEQVVNLFNLGGFVCGIGEWRPEKSGEYGRFHVATAEETGQK